MKKGASKKTAGKTDLEKSILSRAIKDLELEIRKLAKDKSDYQNALKSTSSAIDVDREKEKELQERIAKLIEKEAKLNQQKKNLETKIDRISDKISKMSKIKVEMSDI